MFGGLLSIVVELTNHKLASTTAALPLTTKWRSWKGRLEFEKASEDDDPSGEKCTRIPPEAMIQEYLMKS